MDKIPQHNAIRSPWRQPETTAEIRERGLQLDALVDHFAPNQETVGNLRVSFHRFQFEGHDVKLFRTEWREPSTGLRAAASGVAGVAGSLLGWVAPKWGQALKNWSQDTSTQIEKTDVERHVTDPRGDNTFEKATFLPGGKVELTLSKLTNPNPGQTESRP